MMGMDRMEVLLREVRARLADGRITRHMFDMGLVTNDCNTCGCIGGWALIIDAQERGAPLTNTPTSFLCEIGPPFGTVRERQLYELFFRYPEYGGLTPGMGVQAIDSFLAGRNGNPWDYVL